MSGLASRIRELGLGIRLDTYGFEDEQLRRAVDRLAGDPDLRSRASALGDAVRAVDGRLEVGSPRWPDSRHDRRGRGEAPPVCERDRKGTDSRWFGRRM
jgi:hypothetical protein